MFRKAGIMLPFYFISTTLSTSSSRLRSVHAGRVISVYRNIYIVLEELMHAMHVINFGRRNFGEENFWKNVQQTPCATWLVN